MASKLRVIETDIEVCDCECSTCGGCQEYWGPEDSLKRGLIARRAGPLASESRPRFVELWERQRRGENVLRELDDLYHDVRIDLGMNMSDGIQMEAPRW